MKSLDKQQIKKLLDLKSSLLISDAIAQRQLEVIRRGFNHLYNEGNNALYIADEVGLGKTYVALGIASLLRHFSSTPEFYQDVILVPKENLQYKWEKEIKQFVNHNYLLLDNRVKTVIGSPAGEIIQKAYLCPIPFDHAAYHLYRNSQFSLAFNWRNENKKYQLEVLSDRLSNPVAIDILDRAERMGYFYASNKSYLKKLYAYLLSICNPEIELLIVDEGHNFKHGLGDLDDSEVSDRNNVVTRFLGLKRNTEEDQQIFAEFPELKKLVKPKVQKLIILSATPKTESLKELKCQFDCFLSNHILSGMKGEAEIKDKLPEFLIRGNMEYEIGENIYTRNLCRLEHRNGNVIKHVDAPPLAIKDNEQAIVLGILQYSTIKHLGAKNNASFELGMLAGFETFRLDQEKMAFKNDSQTDLATDIAEYEEVRTRKTRTSADYDVLKAIIDSYKSKFGCLPPHPKQDAIVDAAFQLMIKGEKSLIFVRRVASAYELERRLLDKWEEAVFAELNNKWVKRFASKQLQQMLSCYKDYKENRELAENVEEIFKGVSEKLLSKKEFLFDFVEPQEADLKKAITIGLYFLYNNYKGVEDIEEWYSLLSRHSNLRIIKSELVVLSYQVLERHFEVWREALVNKDQLDIDEVTDAYYFHSYFAKSNRIFKTKLYSTDWFDFNYYRFNNHFKIASFRSKDLNAEYINKQVKDRSNLAEVQEYFLKHIEEESFRENLSVPGDLHPLLEKTTLLTEILLQTCEQELSTLISSLKNVRKAEFFTELIHLIAIVKATLRNGAGFLPLFIADRVNSNMIKDYLSIILDEESVFHQVVKEVRTIVKDYTLIRAVNFPESETVRQMESKLRFQTPVLGLTGQSKRNKSNIAAQFRMPGFPFVLITTDIFREGEDLHTYCQNIYHYGIAWNCSDMEQRTGRIDRINSMSHRKMEVAGSVQFDERVHVFYPYVKQTLEVNQVSKLFSSINSFVETFNDFTEPILAAGLANTKDAIENIPSVVEKPLHSKFEHTYFKGYDCTESCLEPGTCIGMQMKELAEFIRGVEMVVADIGSYYYGPELDISLFRVTGDINLETRRARRGPFKIVIKNDLNPGTFIIEALSHLFKITTKIQRAARELGQRYSGFYITEIDDFYALAFRMKVQDYQAVEFKEKLFHLIVCADEAEEVMMKGEDANVFG